jgi:hypothetical protein
MSMVKLKNKSMLVPVSVPCYDWKEESGEHVKKTVIIAPIHIIESEDESIGISWACSRGVSCRDQDCRYSHATHNHAPNERNNPEQTYEETFG